MSKANNQLEAGPVAFDNLKHLAYFAAVVEAGTFTAAAERLGVTKAVVSQQVARLEREYRTQLLTRSTRRVIATDAGLAFYQRCAVILREAGDAFDELLDVIHRYPDHVWVFLHEFPALTAERADQFRKRRRKYEQRVEAILQAGVDAGEFCDVDVRLTALAWLGMHNYTYLWLKPGGRVSARDVAAPFAEIFIRGIATT